MKAVSRIVPSRDLHLISVLDNDSYAALPSDLNENHPDGQESSRESEKD